MTQNNEFPQWFYHFRQQAKLLNERRLVILVGDNVWASSLLQTLNDFDDEESQSGESWLTYGENPLIKSNVQSKRFRDKLGSESDFVVITEQQITVDAFAALSGTIVAGGVLFLLINELSSLKESYFFTRFLTLVNCHSEHVILKQNSLFFPVVSSKINDADDTLIKTEHTVLVQPLAYGCATKEQVIAVDAVIKVIKGKSKRPLVITADRGRGKSSALAIACAQLLLAAKNDNKLHIIVTAAEFKSVDILFARLASSLPDGQQKGAKFSVINGEVEFVALDRLIEQKPKASLVLVDESAAIPVYLLEKLLFSYSRLVFASTVHGYEGAGRGFTIKFQQTLAATFPQWRSLHIDEPIRWRSGDPLEQLVFDTCLLNAELPSLPEYLCAKATKSQATQKAQEKNKEGIFKFITFTSAQLADDESILSQVFAILVTAHYQTKPSDVQTLLDNEKVQLACLISENSGEKSIVAVALLMHEGSYQGECISISAITAVKQGNRRLRNHFIPQSLFTQCGVEHAFDYHYLRVMRIAVHPQIHHHGIGSLFLDEIRKFANSNKVDFLAASFGATSALVSFWLSSEYKLARMGFSKDKASGEQSALVLLSLTKKSQPLFSTISNEFYRSFDYLLVDEYKNLSPELVALILRHCPQSSRALLTPQDDANIKAFAYGHRQYSSCVFSLHLWLKQQIGNHFIDNEALPILISRIMQKHSIHEVSQTYGFTGKKSLEQFLKAKIISALQMGG